MNVIIAELEAYPIAPAERPFLANASIEERYYVSVGKNGDVESALSAMRRYLGDDIQRREVRVAVKSDSALKIQSGVTVLTFEDTSL